MARYTLVTLVSLLLESPLFRRRAPRPLATLIGLIACAALAMNCSSSDGVIADSGSADDEGNSRGGGSTIDLNSPGGGGNTGADGLSPLCGVGSCMPDDAKSCDLGMGGESAQGGQGGASGFPAGPGDLGPQGSSCQVSTVCDGDECAPQRSCGAVGSGERGAPCFGSSDCAAGFACIGDTATGSCQPYCCRGTTDACGAQDFCGSRPLVGAEDTLVPVCVPTEKCSLTEPFPCPEGRSCGCSGDRACVVVRSDGQTACAVPAKGKDGDTCSGDEPGACAHGYVCSEGSGCLKLCNTVGSESGCDQGDSCQTPAGFPTDLGVCVSHVDGDSVAK